MSARWTSTASSARGGRLHIHRNTTVLMAIRERTIVGRAARGAVSMSGKTGPSLVHSYLGSRPSSASSRAPSRDGLHIARLQCVQRLVRRLDAGAIRAVRGRKVVDRAGLTAEEQAIVDRRGEH